MVKLSVNLSDYTGGLPGVGAHGPHQRHWSKFTRVHNGASLSHAERKDQKL